MVCLSFQKKFSLLWKNYDLYQPGLARIISRNRVWLREKKSSGLSTVWTGRRKNFNAARRRLLDYLEIDPSSSFPGKTSLSEQYVSGPFRCAVEITHFCPYRCRHCYGSFHPGRGNTLPREKLKPLLEKLVSSGIKELELTGGEPTAHPSFYSVLKDCLQLFPRVIVNTSGVSLKPEMISDFQKQRNRLSFQVDLPGADPDFVDWFCDWQGALKRSRQTIRLLSEKGFKSTVSMPVTPQNLFQIKKTAQLARNLGAQDFSLFPVFPAGRGSTPRLQLSAQEKERLSQIMKSLTPADSKKTGNPLNCGAGTRQIVLTPSGEIKACLLSEELNLGNAFNEDPARLLSRNRARILREIYPPQSDFCGECPELELCRDCLVRGLKNYRQKESSHCSWGLFYGRWLLESRKETHFQELNPGL